MERPATEQSAPLEASLPSVDRELGQKQLRSLFSAPRCPRPYPECCKCWAGSICSPGPSRVWLLVMPLGTLAVGQGTYTVPSHTPVPTWPALLPLHRASVKGETQDGAPFPSVSRLGGYAASTSPWSMGKTKSWFQAAEIDSTSHWNVARDSRRARDAPVLLLPMENESQRVIVWCGRLWSMKWHGVKQRRKTWVHQVICWRDRGQERTWGDSEQRARRGEAGGWWPYGVCVSPGKELCSCSYRGLIKCNSCPSSMSWSTCKFMWCYTVSNKLTFTLTSLL